MTTTHPLTRRSFLALAGVGAGAVAVGAALPSVLGGSGGEASTTPATSATATTGSTATALGSTTTTAAAATAHGMGDVSTENLTIVVRDGIRSITTASYPDHPIDSTYRYAGTPSRQSLTFEVTTSPTIAASPTMVRTGQVVGVHLDSVVFDPTTAGYYGGQGSEWNENARSLDAYGAHTRPDGFYHYHAVTDQWISDPSVHSSLVGWAADGFPIYLRYGYADPEDPASGVAALTSGYRLRSGTRPSGPGGAYDGTYVADYEYVDGLGSLDECNGRTCVTPEFPEGTYAYFLTDAWPYVPHWLRGTPDPSFAPGSGGGSAPTGGPPAGS